MFELAFTPGPHVDVGQRFGTITVGIHTETFVAQIGYWSQQDYERQWHAAARRLLDGCDRSGFLVSVADPACVEIFRWWPAWREGGRVYVHEQLILLREFDPPFDLADPYRHVGEREQISAEGARISEWRVRIADVAAFVERHAGYHVPA